MHNTLILEENLKEVCCYCGNNLENKEWDSEFYEEFHYKTITCNSCNKKVSTKVNFLGSGHDSWDKTNKWKKRVNHEKEEASFKTTKNLVALIK